MNKRTKIFAGALSLLALSAGTLAQQGQQAADSIKARRLADRPELTYYDGHVGVEFQVKNLADTPVGDREVRVIDLDPSLPKLRGGVLDDRAPRSGVMELNGMLFPLEVLPDGGLRGKLPQGAFHWYSSNVLTVRVFDDYATPSGNPSGRPVVTWRVATGSLF